VGEGSGGRRQRSDERGRLGEEEIGTAIEGRQGDCQETYGVTYRALKEKLIIKVLQSRDYSRG
jgi:hypothetical protein